MTGAADPMMGFPAGTRFSPYVALHNTTAEELRVAANVQYMQASQPKTAQIAPIILEPHESRLLQAEGLLSSSGLKDLNGSITLLLSYRGEGGDLLLATGSVDQTGTYVFEVLPQAVAESGAKFLKQWNVADGNDTMIAVFNAADHDQELYVTLSYTGGVSRSLASRRQSFHHV